MLLCVCEICNCGRHRCKTLSKAPYGKGSQGCIVSEYTEKYPGYKSFQPPKSLKPKQEEKRNYERMEGMTTFRSDFIPYKVSRRPGKHWAEYHPIPGKLDLTSTYRQEFVPHKVEPAFPRRPKEGIRGAKSKMDTVPTYKDEFRQWEITKRESSKPKVSYHPPTEKFGNTTTFQADFIPQGFVHCESFKPPNVTKLSDAPFDAVTSNQLDYIPHPVRVHVVKAHCEYKPSNEPMQDLTSYRDDYQGLPGHMPKSCKPEHVPLSYDAPFQSSTEFRDCFQQWDVSPQYLRKTAVYTRPTEQMDMNTTTGTTFIKHQVQPFVPAKTPSKPVCSSAPFQGSSTMKDDFKSWKIQRQEIICKAPEIHRPSGKMEDMTTFKAHYIQHKLQPNISCKPVAAPLRSEAPFDEDTTYRKEFTPKKINVCPASLESMPGFVFDKVDESGHRFFFKVNSQEQKSAGCAV
ncbi:stabilizer of axonemal microtubules 2 [Neoarius graeffei]|uniref:stabilizer of axonemal microtubules 2 n=1 Tax=Neoarius graeffei TaxID=443677 RepID=UPI00298D1957|nr:stabilizer of axonemal microtubules 2 [Neoarius graeffei]